MGTPGFGCGPAAAVALACTLALLAGCSGDDARAAPGDAALDVTVRPDVTPEEFNFNVDVPGCPPDVPNHPCNMLNQVCPAPPECDPCFGGYVMRAPNCECQGFWACDTCGDLCERCDAGTVYFDPMCQNPKPVDAGIDVRIRPEAGADAASDSTGEAATDAAG